MKHSTFRWCWGTRPGAPEAADPEMTRHRAAALIRAWRAMARGRHPYLTVRRIAPGTVRVTNFNNPGTSATIRWEPIRAN